MNAPQWSELQSWKHMDWFRTAVPILEENQRLYGQTVELRKAADTAVQEVEAATAGALPVAALTKVQTTARRAVYEALRSEIELRESTARLAQAANTDHSAFLRESSEAYNKRMQELHAAVKELGFVNGLSDASVSSHPDIMRLRTQCDRSDAGWRRSGVDNAKLLTQARAALTAAAGEL